jgi:hypothetical protein
MISPATRCVLGYQLGRYLTGWCSGSLAGMRVMGRLEEWASSRVSVVVDINAHVAAAEKFELAKVDIDGASRDVPDDHVVRPGVMHRCGQVVHPAWPGQHEVLPPGIGAEPAYRLSGSRRDQQSITQPARTAAGPWALLAYRARTDQIQRSRWTGMRIGSVHDVVPDWHPRRRRSCSPKATPPIPATR